MKPITDPALLAELNAPGEQPVTDPALLSELNTPDKSFGDMAMESLKSQNIPARIQKLNPIAPMQTLGGVAVAGLQGVSEIAATGIGTIIKSVYQSATSNEVSGPSFSDRLDEDHKNVSAFIADTMPKIPVSPQAQLITYALARIIGEVGVLFGDLNYKLATISGDGSGLIKGTSGMKDAAPFIGAIGQGIIAVAPMLFGGRSSTPKPAEATNPVADFAIQYPNVSRRIEASKVGTSPLTKDRAAQPERHFASVVDDAVNKELGITQDMKDNNPMLAASPLLFTMIGSSRAYI